MSKPIDARDVELGLRGRAESVVRAILPNARKDANVMRVGSIAGEKGQSLAVWISGAKVGCWVDFASDEKGDMLWLVAKACFGGNLGEAFAWGKSFLGLDDLDPNRLAKMRAEAAQAQASADVREREEAEAKKQGARALWLQGVPIAGTAAAAYLEGRGLSETALGHWPGAIRFHEEVWHSDVRVKIPAMLSQMVTADGAHVATHRTYLGREPGTRAWVKAEAADIGVGRGHSKKIIGKSAGAFVPLRKGASGKSAGQLARPEAVYVTEGIEDALTVAMAKPDARVVAAYSLKNLGFVQFPALLDPIVLVADRDDNVREVDALERAIGRQQARGHRVQIVVPPEGVKDVNAWLLGDIEMGRQVA